MPSAAVSISRHFGMDWLRIGAFALLILYHIGMYFVPWDWHVKVAEPQAWTRIPMLATNAWRLPLLFVVSGFASAALFVKLGSRVGFLRSRTSRLLIPLIFGMAVVVAPQPWVELQFKHGYVEGFWHFWTSDYFRFGALDGIVLPTWNHLWFVAYLWVYTLGLALALWLLPESWRTAIARIAERTLAGPLLLIVPIALLVLHGFVLFPGAGETHALIDDLPAHLVYGPIFLFGWLLARSDALWAAIRRWWMTAGLLALAAFAVVAGIAASAPDVGGSGSARDIAFDLAHPVQGWCAIVALIGIADAFWDREHRWRPMLTEAVFPFYIIHQTIIVLVGWWLLPTGIGQPGALAILLAATIGGCALFYAVGRRIGPLRPLIGLSREDTLPLRRARAGAATSA